MRYVMTAAVLFASLSAAAAARADVESGPKVGEKAPELKVFGVVGTVEKKEADFVAERKGKPTIYVFIQAEQLSRPMARYLKKLDETVNMTEGASIVAVWLTDDKEKTTTYLPRFDMSVKLKSTDLALHPDSQTGPEGWGLNSEASMTTAVTNKGKVTATFSYQSVNETDVPKVEEAFKKALEEK